MSPSIWVVLPGLMVSPAQLQPLRSGLDQLPGRPGVRIQDAWQLPLTAPLDQVRAHLRITNAEPGSIGLIGYSLGGPNAIQWALEHRAEVSALVLLDATDPRPVDLHRRSLQSRLDVVTGAALGLLAPVAASLTPGRMMPGELARAQRQFRFRQSGAWRSFAQDFRDCPDLLRRVAGSMVAAGRGALSDLPGMVLTSDSVPEGRQRALADRLGLAWRRLDGRNHLFPITQPNDVLAAVRGVL